METRKGYLFGVRMATALSALLFLSLGCQGRLVGRDSSAAQRESGTALSVRQYTINGTSFISLTMNSEIAYVALVDSLIPDKDDSTVFLCVAAAFTGKRLEVFQSTNIAGDYVTQGVEKKGYKCADNTGCLFARPDGHVSIHRNCDAPVSMRLAGKEGGSFFQQMLLLHDGADVYRGKPISREKKDFYRAACVTCDSDDFMIVQSETSVSLGDFIGALKEMGVAEALYLDMGGWKYGWYREATDSPAIEFFDSKSPYQTNWLVIRRKGEG